MASGSAVDAGGGSGADAEVASLRAREEKYRLLASTLSDAIWDWDLRTDIVEWNDAIHRTLRYAEGDVGSSSQWWLDRVHPDDRERVVRHLHESLTNSRVSFEVEYRFQYGDSTYATVVDRGAVLCDANDTPLRMVGGMTDITEQRRLAGQLRMAQKMEAVGLLAGGIAHDFNNVLTAILGFASLLKSELADDSPARAYALEIESSAQRVADLTAQLLAFSRLQMVKLEVLDVNEVLTSVNRVLHRVIGEEIRVHMQPGQALPAVRADRAQLERVLMNLTVNARDAMPHGGELVISSAHVRWPIDPPDERTMPRGNYVRLSVRDTGIGMDEETRQRVFDPFFTTKARGEGRGLGLATVYGIVKQIGGYVWVKSAPGIGAAFDVYLPAVAEDASPGSGAWKDHGVEEISGAGS